MNKLIRIISFTAVIIGALLFSNVSCAKEIEINSANFPDETIRNNLMEKHWCYKNIESGKIYLETEQVTYIKTDGVVKDLTGIELLTELENLYVGEFQGEKISLNNPKLTSINIRKSVDKSLMIDVPALENLIVNGSGVLTVLDISKDIKLNKLCVFAGGTLLEIKGLDQMKYLKRLDLYKYPLETVDVSGLSSLEILCVYNSDVKKLELNALTNLNFLSVKELQLESLDLSANHKLETIYCTDNEELASLELPDAVKKAECDNNKLTYIGLVKCSKLEELSVQKNNLTDIDVSKCKKLEKLDVCDNNLSNINLAKCSNLTEVNIDGNKNITSFNATKNKKLESIDIGNTGIKKIDTSKNKKLYKLYFHNTKISKVDLSKNKKLEDISYYGSRVKKLNLSGYDYMRLYYEVTPGTKIKLGKYIGKGFKYDSKEKHIYVYETSDIKVNSKKQTVTVLNNALNSDYEFTYKNDDSCPRPNTYYKDISFKKGKKTRRIYIYVK